MMLLPYLIIGFNNFSFEEFSKEGEIISSAYVSKGLQDSIDIVCSQDLSVVIEQGKENDVIQTITINENITAPIEENQKLGEVTFTLDNEIISTIDLVANTSISKKGFFTNISYLTSNWFSLLRS